MGKTSYAVALGSNRWHGRYGRPAEVIAAAIDRLAAAGFEVTARSAIRATPAMGGAGRGFANAVIIVRTPLAALGLLAMLKATERAFGRRPGKRWGPRVLDLDILLTAPGGVDRKHPTAKPGTLALPHPGMTSRDFVLQPLEEIAPGWRHPRSGLTVRQLRARLHRAKPVDRLRPRP